jgi:hypothetical protein
MSWGRMHRRASSRECDRRCGYLRRPGGNGNKLGILRSGRQVKLVGTFKPNDWCNVVLPELPAGSGWV